MPTGRSLSRLLFIRPISILASILEVTVQAKQLQGLSRTFIGSRDSTRIERFRRSRFVGAYIPLTSTMVLRRLFSLNSNNGCLRRFSLMGRGRILLISKQERSIVAMGTLSSLCPTTRTWISSRVRLVILTTMMKSHQDTSITRVKHVLLT
jgi:hypothetical protein